ncbi:helix-turn-helix domain-containing protein [Nocardioides sp. AE5]|uniref:helix-turn-helix domain-containing protein n=1 Tax=Nocardioides sp. AE5 TaxID=2962573 RepID=UPI002880E2FC|nr:helix-turn-helix domain-containing protein [Nocardioides sp. AE5]MDT0201358.1 helix-turn-helix domain-containing protein [Nocardioides sp. AE5]
MTTTVHTLGETIAVNIAQHMNRLDWDFDRLAEESALTWGELVRHRADASAMSLDDLALIATALGVTPADLARSAESCEQTTSPLPAGTCWKCGLRADALVHNATANGHDFEAGERL